MEFWRPERIEDVTSHDTTSKVYTVLIYHVHNHNQRPSMKHYSSDQYKISCVHKVLSVESRVHMVGNFRACPMIEDLRLQSRTRLRSLI